MTWHKTNVSDVNKAEQEKTILDFKFSTLLLVRVDMVQVIRARVCGGYFFLECLFQS